MMRRRPKSLEVLLVRRSGSERASPKFSGPTAPYCLALAMRSIFASHRRRAHLYSTCFSARSFNYSIRSSHILSFTPEMLRWLDPRSEAHAKGSLSDPPKPRSAAEAAGSVWTEDCLLSISVQSCRSERKKRTTGYLHPYLLAFAHVYIFTNIVNRTYWAKFQRLLIGTPQTSSTQSATVAVLTHNGC